MSHASAPTTVGGRSHTQGFPVAVIRLWTYPRQTELPEAGVF